MSTVELTTPDEINPDSMWSKSIPQLQVAWDATSLNNFDECPRKYFYSIVRGLRSKKDSAALLFGGLIHECLEVWDKARVEEKKSHDDAVIDAVRYAMVEGQKLDDLGDELRNRFALVRALIWYTEKWKNDAAKICTLANGKAAIELSFRMSLELINPDGKPYLLCGHMDGVVHFADQYLVRERKHTKYTLGDHYYKQFKNHNQVTVYTIASRVVLTEPADGVMIDAIQVAKGFSREGRALVNIQPERLEDFLRDLEIKLRQAEQYATDGYWPMNRSHCYNYGGCQFLDVCSAGPKTREAMLKDDFVVKRWDPLAIR